MKSENDIRNEVEKTMGALDDIRRADAGPFFYSRLESRMRQQADGPGHAKLSWGIAAVMILIIVNIFTIRDFAGDEAEEGLAQFTEMYVPSLPNLYESEPINEN